MFFDTIMSWLVFAAYAMLILIITSVMCTCGYNLDCDESAVQNHIRTESSENIVRFDNMQASAELTGYLKTPIPFRKVTEIKDRLDEQEKYIYRQRADPYDKFGMGIVAIYEPIYLYPAGNAVNVDLEHILNFLGNHPELFKTPDKDFLTYGDFLTRLSSYRNRKEAVYAFRLLTKLMFTTGQGTITKTFLADSDFDVYLSDTVNGFTKAPAGEPDGQYVSPFIYVYFDDDGSVFDEINDFGNLCEHEQWLEEHVDGDSSKTKKAWTTGKFKGVTGECSDIAKFTYEGLKFLPSSVEGGKIAVGLINHREYRKKGLLT